jgi:hypothetical protein
MDTKKTLIIFGSLAAVGAAFYFILKPNSAKAATPAKKNPKFPTGLEYPDGFPKVNTAAKTKDCVVSSFNCVSTTNETIQIPLDADCRLYQPAMPQCAPPMGGGYKVAPDYSFDDGYTYYGGYYGGYYTPSGGLPYSDRRVVKNTGYYSDYAMKPKLGGPPRGRGSYGGGYGIQMVERDSPYALMMYNRRPAYV